MHPKELPLGKDYANEFTTATVINTKLNSIKACVCYNIEIAILYKQSLYSDDGDKTILSLLRKNNMCLKRNIFYTHRETSIGFIKYISPSITRQAVIRSWIELVLYSMSFPEEEINHFITSTGGKKRKASNDIISMDKSTNESNKEYEYTPIQLPAYNLSTNKINYSNRK